MSDNIIIRAAQFARLCHKDQSRKFDRGPYILHPMRVAGRVAIHHVYPSAEVVAAAWLHDVIEDCGVPCDHLVQLFGSDVAGMVLLLTNPVYPENRKPPRAERKAEQCEQLNKAPYEVQMIKAYDRIDNLLDMPAGDAFTKLYAKESIALCDSLTKIDGSLSNQLESIARGLCE